MSRFKTAPQDIFISTGVDSDGPVPGLHSMLAFGSAAVTMEGEVETTFTRNLERLPGAAGDEATLQGWQQNAAAWEVTRVRPADPARAMGEYLDWLKSLDGRLVFVGMPASPGHAFIQYYLHRFAGESPFVPGALDIKTYAMATLQNSAYSRTSKDRFPRHWLDAGLKQGNGALDEAIQQGLLFMTIFRENQARGFPVMPASTEQEDLQQF